MADTQGLIIKPLIKECQQGKPQAQRTIYDLLAPKMFGVCVQYCKNRDDAQDCLQEGFIRVFSRIDTFRFEGSFEGWVRRIVVNTLIEHFRKKRPESPVEDMANFQHAETDAESEPLYSEKELREAVTRLPRQYQMVFNLYVLEELSHEEIAKSLGISVGTSKSNLSRARQWLRDHLSSGAQQNERS